MTPAPSAQRSDAARNHEAILNASIAVLADAPAASMAEIAHASGIGRTTLYRHFPDRMALVQAIYDRLVAEAGLIAAARLTAEPQATDDPVTVVAQLADELAALGTGYRFLARYEAQLAADQQRGEPLISYLRAAQDRGAIAAELDPEWLLAVIVALIGEAARHPFDDPARRTAQLTAAVVRLLG